MREIGREWAADNRDLIVKIGAGVVVAGLAMVKAGQRIMGGWS